MLDVELYETDNGKQPVSDFILSLDIKVSSKLSRAIDILAEKGYEAREPLTKCLGNGLFELRCLLSSANARLIFFYDKDKIVITNGFIKKTNKTPRKEIALAKKYRADWMKRNF